MRTIGWIAIFIGVANLVAGKFLPGFSFAIVGSLMLIFYKDKKKEEPTSTTSFVTNEESIQDKYFQDSLIEIKTVEKIIKTDFSLWEHKDVIETVESFKRWASNLKCNISEIKKIFLNRYFENFKNEDIDASIRYFKSEESKEAHIFQINNRNTCAHYMTLWLTEYQSAQICKKQSKGITDNPSKSTSKLQVRNRMSATDLIKSQNAELKFYSVPIRDKQRFFFECGSINRGYISPAVVNKIDSVQLEDLQYAECASENTDDWVPCIMLKSNRPLAPGSLCKRTMGAEILNSKAPFINTDDDLPF